MKHNQAKRRRGALERRQRDLQAYTNLLADEEAWRPKYQKALNDVTNLKRKLGMV